MTAAAVPAGQATQIANLRAALQRDGGAPVEVLETHISWVLLAGAHAYKIKKAIRLDFLDFSTLDLRRRYCEEELRLNRRYAPRLYLAVIAIGGRVEAPVLDVAGPALEYAVKMRRFEQDQLGNRALAEGRLLPAHLDGLARSVAAFHAACPRTNAGSAHGSADDVLQWALENFAEFARLPDAAADAHALGALRLWTEREHAARNATFTRRQHDGFVRECHGDLHLGNIALVDGELTPFDGIEFNVDLRWIDVMNEIAFLAMDLEDRGRGDLASRFLDAYLAATGDYAGLGVLRFYLVYRALVRAKVALLRRAQAPADAVPPLLDEYRRHVALARRLARPAEPAVILTHGLAGSGKTAVTGGLLEAIGAVRLRSDVERKRLAGLEPGGQSHSALGGGLYAPDRSADTYRRLLELTRMVVEAGYPAVVDAAFLQQYQRRLFAEWAREHGVPFVILNLNAPDAELRARIARRAAAGADASEADAAVLDFQLRTREPLSPGEMEQVIDYDATAPVERACLAATWRGLLDRLASERRRYGAGDADVASSGDPEPGGTHR